MRSRSSALADSPKTARSNAAIPLLVFGLSGKLSWTNPPEFLEIGLEHENGKRGEHKPTDLRTIYFQSGHFHV